jgi:hypothetical protein
MGTPIRDGTLTPKDLRYYAPRKLRDDDASDWESFQFASDAEELQNPKAANDPKADTIAPLPDMFHPHASSEIDGKPRTARLARFKVLALAGGAAAVGLFIGIALLNLIQGRDETRAPSAPDIPLAARLQSATTDLQKVSQPVVTPVLTVSEASGDMNVSLPLGLEVKNYTAGAVVELSGLPTGTVLSTGSAAGNGQWRIAVDDLPKTRITPPAGYVGPMTVTVQVAVGNGQAAVRRPLRLTWRQIPPPPDKPVGLRAPNPEAPPVRIVEVAPPSPKIETPTEPKKVEPSAAPAKTDAAIAPAAPKKIETPATPPEPKKVETPAAPAKTDTARKMDVSQVVALLQRADELMASGDLAAARLLLQRVAETKNAQAAFQLASTYDPAVLKKLSNNSVAADPALAQLWYERARDWGSPDASSPLEALASRATGK